MTVKIITKPLLWWSDYHYSYTAYYIQCKRRDRYFIIMSSIIQMRTLSNCHYLMCNYEQRCYLTTNKELAIFKMILYRLQGLLYHTRHASFHHNALQHNPWTWRTWQIHFHRVTCFAFQPADALLLLTGFTSYNCLLLLFYHYIWCTTVTTLLRHAFSVDTFSAPAYILITHALSATHKMLPYFF